MLLAAGKGERMRPLTLTTPKPLLKVGDKALIDWHLERLVSAGVTDFVINLAWLGEQIEAHCGAGERYGARIEYSHEPGGPLETAGGIIQALPALGDAPFLVVNSDTWTDIDFTRLIQRASAGVLKDSGAHLVLVDNPEHNPTGDFSLAGEGTEVATEGRVTERADSTLTFSGVGLYHPWFFKGYSTGKRPLLPLLLNAISEHRLTGEHHTGAWTDVGTPERLRQLDQAVRSKG